MRNLTVERLREVLSYDPDSGQFRWRVQLSAWGKVGQVAGTKGERGYIHICVDRNICAAHRLAWLHTHGAWPKYEIDHINGVKDDNRLINLRDVPRRINQQNQRRAIGGRTGLIGATFHRATGKYRARVWVDGRNISLGLYATPEEAHEAYVSHKRIHHEGCTL